MFSDRSEAGRLLGDRLGALNCEAPIVLALPRGGVPVAAAVATRLDAPLDVALVRKIGAPGEPELAVGAVAVGESPEIVLNVDLVRALALSQDYIDAAAARELAVIEGRRRDYRAMRPAVQLEGRTVIVVDDGVATGMTMQAALRQARKQRPGSIIAAAPAASSDAIHMLGAEADRVVVLSSPRNFRSVGSFYRSFTQVTDDEVASFLRAAASRDQAAV